jgi:hypothetical protein
MLFPYSFGYLLIDCCKDISYFSKNTIKKDIFQSKTGGFLNKASFRHE